MTFDNSRKIISQRIWLFIVTVMVLAWLALAYMGRVIKFPLLGKSDIFWTVIFVTIWVIVALIPVFLSYQYISYSDDDEKITLRYFNSGIVGGRKNSVEISMRTFAGYKTEKKLFGLVRSIILFQRIREGVAKYPPVYISALNRTEREKLFASLNRLMPKE